MTKITEAIVLAGGFGTRLREIVNNVPKSLAPVNGRPFLDWVFEDLRGKGIQRVILATGYCSEQIESRYQDGYRGMRIDFSREGTPLGTGGAIKRAIQQIETPYVVVLNGDTLLEWDPERLLGVARCTELPITVGLKRVLQPDRYGVVVLDGMRITAFLEKRNGAEGLINAGLYLLKTAAVSWPATEIFSFEREVLEPDCMRGLLAGCLMEGYFIDIGVPESFLSAQVSVPKWVEGIQRRPTEVAGRQGEDDI